MLPGGPASKIGHRYETWWTVYQLLRILQGETRELRIEPPGIDPAEFVVTTARHREYHQVKRSHPNSKWSFASLRSFLRSVFEMLSGNEHRFVFVSGSEARELSELCYAAHRANTVREFESIFLASDKRRKTFKDLCRYGVRRRLIQNALVPTEAPKQILTRLTEAATDCVVTGSAGTGKTACVIELVDALRVRSQPVLAFRLDRTVSVSTTEKLGYDLGLEESPVLMLAEAARAVGRPGVLIVDQLDAVSTMSGRSLGAFEIVEQLIQEARGIRDHVSVHTVVVCREFDWKNDSRLRGLLPADSARVEVTVFGDEQVRSVLRRAGFNPVLFRTRQLELLKLPQNLALFLDSGFDPSIEPGFDTVNRLFAAYWKYKRGSVERAAGQDQWMLVIKTMWVLPVSPGSRG